MTGGGEAPSPPVAVITGPSGVGKGTLIRELLGRCTGTTLAVSATTRNPREGEVDGRDYHFLSPTEFAELVETDQFVEHAEYAGNHYGTLRAELARPARAIVLEIDLQGARQVRTALPEAIQIFIAPPSLDDLERRLRGRASDSPEAIAKRMEVAPIELAARTEFAHEIVNGELEPAVMELCRLVGSMSESAKRLPPLPNEESTK